jgi:uncharacterized protein
VVAPGAPGPARRTMLRAGLAVVAAAAGCSRDPGAAHPDLGPGPLVIAAGQPQGVYEQWASAWSRRFRATYPGTAMVVRSTTGSPVNLALLRGGEVTLAIAALDSCVEALAPSTDRRRPGDGDRAWLRAVARLYDDYLHLLVRAGSPITRVADLRGRRVVVGATGSGTALIANRVLALGDVRPAQTQEQGLVRGLDLLRAGAVDAVFWSGGLPTAAVARVAGERDAGGVRLVPLDDAGQLLQSSYPVTYRLATIPAGTYRNSRSVATFAVANVLTVAEQAPWQQVRASLQVLFGGTEAIAADVPAFAGFDARLAVETQPVALHPEAERYYRKAKV